MSIENHKWFDATGVSQLGRERGELWIEFDSKAEPTILGINKQDAKVIAKHFDVDNESLVEGIKELIDKFKEREDDINRHTFERDAYLFAKCCLMDLIDNSTDKEKLDNE
jgi:hypothetical protein